MWCVSCCSPLISERISPSKICAVRSTNPSVISLLARVSIWMPFRVCWMYVNSELYDSVERRKEWEQVWGGKVLRGSRNLLGNSSLQRSPSLPVSWSCMPFFLLALFLELFSMYVDDRSLQDRPLDHRRHPSFSYSFLLQHPLWANESFEDSSWVWNDSGAFILLVSFFPSIVMPACTTTPWNRYGLHDCVHL